MCDHYDLTGAVKRVRESVCVTRCEHNTGVWLLHCALHSIKKSIARKLFSDRLWNVFIMKLACTFYKLLAPCMTKMVLVQVEGLQSYKVES